MAKLNLSGHKNTYLESQGFVTLDMKALSIEGENQIDEEDFNDIPATEVFALRSKNIVLPGVVSKGGSTPFRMGSLPTYDQGVIEIEVYPNEEDFPDWQQTFPQYRLFNRAGDDSILVPLKDGCYARVSLQEPSPGEITVLVKKEWTNNKRLYLPPEAVEYTETLTTLCLRGLSRCGWEPDPSDVARIKEDVARWNETQWVSLYGSYVETDLDYGDDDSRKYTSTRREGVWYQDPTGYFRGRDRHPASQWGVYTKRPRERDAEKEIYDLFPVQIWVDRWLTQFA